MMKTSVAILAVALTVGFATARGTARGDDLKRYPIPARCIQAESGHCYIAGMDFGEDGDKEAGNKSGLLLFENLDNLGFKVMADPDTGRTRPIISSCDVTKSIVEVDARTSALNYSTE